MGDHVPVYPSVMRRTISHPKNTRNKTGDEPRNPDVLSRRLAIVACKKYREIDHNKMSCNGKITIDRAMPKGGKTKKAKTNKGGKGKEKSNEKQAEIAQGSQAPQAT